MCNLILPKRGEIWTPWYPSRNRIGLPIEYVPRRILVTGTSDFSNTPLHADYFLQRPMVRRGSILVYGRDLDLADGVIRKFYLEATSEYDLPLLKIACCDEFGQVVDWIGREYEPTVYDRAEMMATIGEWNRDNAGCGLELGIFYGEAAA